jgi:hypothetical protein
MALATLLQFGSEVAQILLVLGSKGEWIDDPFPLRRFQRTKSGARRKWEIEFIRMPNLKEDYFMRKLSDYRQSPQKSVDLVETIRDEKDDATTS